MSLFLLVDSTSVEGWTAVGHMVQLLWVKVGSVVMLRRPGPVWSSLRLSLRMYHSLRGKVLQWVGNKQAARGFAGDVMAGVDGLMFSFPMRLGVEGKMLWVVVRWLREEDIALSSPFFCREESFSIICSVVCLELKLFSEFLASLIQPWLVYSLGGS